MSTFSDVLKDLRYKKGWSQQRLADELQISKSSVNMYERGEREPSFETLEHIADIFNVDLDYLIGRSPIERKYTFERREESAMDMHVGKQIKKSRLERKMTQAELAEKVGCATITIRQYENGSREPGLAALQKIAFALGVHIEDLIEEETFDTGAEFDERWKELAESANGESLTVVRTTDLRKSINHALDQMTEEGQIKVAERAAEVLEVPRYRKDPPKD